MRRKSSGFTLIEMLITVSMVGIMAAMSTASIQPQLQKRRLIEGAQQIEQVLRRAQETAIARARTTYVLFNSGSNTFTFVVGDPCRPDIKATPLVDSAASDRIQSVSTEVLATDVTITATTFDHGACTAFVPANANDLSVGTTRLNIVAFDYKGRVINNNNNVGKYVRLNSTATGNNFGNYDVYVLTTLGDIGIVKPIGR
jgi:type II secretion system protein H